MQQKFSIEGNLVDVDSREIYHARLDIQDDRIIQIEKLADQKNDRLPFILPGFVDAHVHIESSMLIPSEFARLAVVHGTVATVSDPHEIANVCGMKGIEFMINDGASVPFKFNFGAPSCVPATVFETAGAVIGPSEIQDLMKRKEIGYLSEVMNFPGVISEDTDIMQKIEVAKKAGKPIDGHAPGLTGSSLIKYINSGISTDHESFTKEEALEKLNAGMKILIREGSAARNFEALADLMHEHSDMMMFCSDDKHPDSLVEGHINSLCARAVEKGIDIFKIIKVACINPVLHYKMKCGLLRKNDFADFILVKDLKDFHVIKTFIDGKLVADNGKTLIGRKTSGTVVNNFNRSPVNEKDFQFSIADKIPVIEALDGQLITNKLTPASAPDPSKDVLTIAVINRYTNAPVAKALIKNFGLKNGAIASSVAHDSHNIVCVGVDAPAMTKAVNMIIKEKGGISYVNGSEENILPLPVAGLMSNEDGYQVAKNYSMMDQAVKEMGSGLKAPFMTLSFMALLVIPHIKLSDKGVFDGDEFRLITNANGQAS